MISVVGSRPTVRMPVELAQHSGLSDLYRIGETLIPVDTDYVADSSDGIAVVGVETVRQDSTPPDEVPGRARQH